MTESGEHSGDDVDVSIDETATFAAGDTLSGRVIAQKYELGKLLGKGGMGAVYEAKNQSTLRRCAVKLLVSPELAQHPGIVKRFFREAKASAVAESDHIVQVFDSGTDPVSGAPYLVMELLRGEALEDLIDRVDVLEPRAAAKIVLHAASGLSRAHELGIVHRDIKPANLFLTDRDGGDVLIKVFDFGIAKVKMESFVETSNGLTRTGILIGTPLYMSPEQARGASNVDARTDVWSLGIVLYRMLTGRLPYDNVSSLADLMVAIITAEIPTVRSVAPWVTPELSRVVERSLQRNLEQRFANCGELRAALEETLGGDARLKKSELVPVSAEQRSIAPPSVVPPMDEGVVRAATKSGAGSTTPAMGTKTGSRSIVAIVAAGGVAVVALVLVALGLKSGVTAKPAAESAPSAASTAVPMKTYRLAVPENAKAWVDDVAVSVENASIEISGNPGETRRVRVSRDGAEQAAVIAITDRQLVPNAIELPGGAKPAAVDSAAEPEAKKPPTGDKKPSTPTTAATKPDPKKTDKKPDATKPDKKPPDFATSQDEFNQ